MAVQEVPDKGQAVFYRSGTLGVPITFIGVYNPDQFYITGITKTWFGGGSKTYDVQVQVGKDGTRKNVKKLNDGPAIKLEEAPSNTTYYEVDGEAYIQCYARILIRPKRKE